MITQNTSFRFSAKHPLFILFFPFALILFISAVPLRAQNDSRDVGIYPGNPQEDFSPIMEIDSAEYRNIALFRPAYQSSCYDFNHTAQLVTDGIIATELPGWITTTTSTDGILKRNEREWVLDRHIMTRKTLAGPDAWLQVELSGNSVIPEIDSIHISGNLFVDSLSVQPWEISISGSQNGVQWEKLGSIGGNTLPGDSITGFLKRFVPPNFRLLAYPFPLNTSLQFRFYRINVHSPNVLNWAISELGLYKKGKRINLGGPYHFTSVWKSMGAEREWIYIDLGALCTFDRFVLHWLQRANSVSIQVSTDAQEWKTLTKIPPIAEQTDDIKMAAPAFGRYVRVLMEKPALPDGFLLSEFEIFGTGGPQPLAHPAAPQKTNERIDLAGGGWKLCRAYPGISGEAISQANFNDTNWIVATVPATILTSYLNAGIIPDPNLNDNQLLISDSYFYSDFWYRNEFILPQSFHGRRIFLNFDGINWKAEVFLNGKKLGGIEGAFTQKYFDITDLLTAKKNILAVCIKKNDTPGFIKEQTILSHDANGGEIGADNPTFHASVGWDWIPSIRGRNTGIWNDVFLSASGAVTIEDPFVQTDLPLPDTSAADIQIQSTLRNHSGSRFHGILRGTFGTIAFEQPVILDSGEVKTVTLNPSTHPVLHIKNPKLWWPNGYGEQNLYTVSLKLFGLDTILSDAKSFLSGIREMSYSEENETLKMWVNGKRFIGFGGNWGFSESMLRYRGREYNIAVRYHKEMNFTMIRNWVGQVGDDEFFEACDRYGIMIWQDFWLANPVDGPNPGNNTLFLQNADNFVKRIRNHPSLALYCGRNEGDPPELLDQAIRTVLLKLHPDVHYISNSAFGVVSGGGPYRAMPIRYYFENRATERFHSEMGMPNMVSFESLRQMIPDSSLWPINRIWGVHDFNLESAQRTSSFMKLLEDKFGPVDSLKEWLSLAQWINFEGYRAMFEAQSKNRLGLLLWMSHSAWPSMVWQTYDYYFEPTAAYFGCKKACEPIHIQWNPLSDSIEVVNYRSANGRRITAVMEIRDYTGKLIFRNDTMLNCPPDQTIRCFKLKHPPRSIPVFLICLKLVQGKTLLSENFYWKGTNEEKYMVLRSIPKARLKIQTTTRTTQRTQNITVRITNPSPHPAFMIKLAVIGAKSRKRILPAIFSDNYFLLMPGKKRNIRIEVQKEDLREEKPIVIVE